METLTTIAAAGNLTRAAAERGLTQPALSSMLRRIETRLGQTLFLRGKKGVTPTRAGTLLLNRARDLQHQWRDLENALRQTQDAVVGNYRLAVHATVAVYTVPRFAPQLLRDHPQLHLELLHQPSREVVATVLAMAADLGIAVDPTPHPDLVLTELYRDFIGFWARDENEFTDPDSILVVNPKMPQTASLLRQLQTAPFFAAKRVMATSELKLIEAMVAGGGTVGLLPATIALNSALTEMRPYRNGPREEARISLIRRADHGKTAAARTIRTAILTALRETPPVQRET
nr:LysR family transcriptional regulator [Acanthopleuribacter pedis]